MKDRTHRWSLKLYISMRIFENILCGEKTMEDYSYHLRSDRYKVRLLCIEHSDT